MTGRPSRSTWRFSRTWAAFRQAALTNVDVATVDAVNTGVDGARPERVALFTDIALGDAP